MNSTSSISQMTTSTGESNKELGTGWSTWNDLNIGQILLPVLCAAFIATVIIVIACCLIKKKAKPFRRWRERSCHTIETSHDMSENGIYDVIDKVKVGCKSKTNEKVRRNEKLSSNCLLVSQNEISYNKHANIFTVTSPVKVSSPLLDTLLTPPSPPCTKHDWGKFSLTFPVDQDGSPAEEETHKTEEEGVYETLDKYWTLSNTLKRELSAQVSCVPNGQVTPDDHQAIIKALPDAETNPTYETAAKDKILCQLTLFHISDKVEQSRQAESVYYYVDMHNVTAEHGGNLPSMLQNARLQVVQSEEIHPKQSTNITLEPVDGALMPAINETGSHYDVENIKKVTSSRCSHKIYEAPVRTGSIRSPSLIIKKSDSFRDAHSALLTMKENHPNVVRRQSDSSTSSNASSHEATDKILRKLGPLPPVPSIHENSNITGCSRRLNRKYSLQETAELSKSTSPETKFSTFKSDKSTNTTHPNTQCTILTNVGDKEESVYSHYFVLESSDYSSGNEDNIDEKYLE